MVQILIVCNCNFTACGKLIQRFEPPPLTCESLPAWPHEEPAAAGKGIADFAEREALPERHDVRLALADEKSERMSLLPDAVKDREQEGAVMVDDVYVVHVPAVVPA